MVQWCGKVLEKTFARGEKSPGAVESKSCGDKAKAINVLVWAHQCHLLGGKMFPGEFVYNSHRVLPLVKSEQAVGGCGPDPGLAPGCSSLDVLSCHLSPSPLEGRVLLGLWKLSLILKQLEG